MPCYCGHTEEEHGHDPKYPGSTACTEPSLFAEGGHGDLRRCTCIAYEEEADDEPTND